VPRRMPGRFLSSTLRFLSQTKEQFSHVACSPFLLRPRLWDVAKISPCSIIVSMLFIRWAKPMFGAVPGITTNTTTTDTLCRDWVAEVI